MSVTDFFQRGNPEDMEAEMQLEGMAEKVDAKKGSIKKKSKNERTYMLVSVVVLAALTSLGIGIIEGLAERSAGSGGLIISSVPLVHPSSAGLNSAELSNTAGGQNNAIPSGGEVVGNKATHEYELPWCQPQVSDISTPNEVWFASANAAKSADYSADETCAGNE